MTYEQALKKQKELQIKGLYYEIYQEQDTLKYYLMPSY